MRRSLFYSTHRKILRKASHAFQFTIKTLTSKGSSLLPRIVVIKNMARDVSSHPHTIENPTNIGNETLNNGICGCEDTSSAGILNLSKLSDDIR